MGIESTGTSVVRGVFLQGKGVRVRIASGGATNAGRVRTNNEDNYKMVDPLNLYVLSDGMGGEAAGERASSLFPGPAPYPQSRVVVEHRQVRAK